ncbi:hypothetical protein AAG570_013472 [Ranatra chinensis]|uniref:Uncharacterized protein n=1 Tax=Ranatra chinensis TaxID=642074 RepID=A0ABD0YUT2_9HEMI
MVRKRSGAFDLEDTKKWLEGRRKESVVKDTLKGKRLEDIGDKDAQKKLLMKEKRKEVFQNYTFVLEPPLPPLARLLPANTFLVRTKAPDYRISENGSLDDLNNYFSDISLSCKPGCMRDYGTWKRQLIENYVPADGRRVFGRLGKVESPAKGKKAKGVSPRKSFRRSVREIVRSNVAKKLEIAKLKSESVLASIREVAPVAKPARKARSRGWSEAAVRTWKPFRETTRKDFYDRMTAGPPRVAAEETSHPRPRALPQGAPGHLVRAPGRCSSSTLRLIQRFTRGEGSGGVPLEKSADEIKPLREETFQEESPKKKIEVTVKLQQDRQKYVPNETKRAACVWERLGLPTEEVIDGAAMETMIEDIRREPFDEFMWNVIGEQASGGLPILPTVLRPVAELRKMTRPSNAFADVFMGTLPEGWTPEQYSPCRPPVKKSAPTEWGRAEELGWTSEKARRDKARREQWTTTWRGPARNETADPAAVGADSRALQAFARSPRFGKRHVGMGPGSSRGFRPKGTVDYAVGKTYFERSGRAAAHITKTPFPGGYVDPESIGERVRRRCGTRGPYDVFTGPRDQTTLHGYWKPGRQYPARDFPEPEGAFHNSLRKKNYGVFPPLEEEESPSRKEPALEASPPAPPAPRPNKHPFNSAVERWRRDPLEETSPAPGRYTDFPKPRVTGHRHIFISNTVRWYPGMDSNVGRWDAYSTHPEVVRLNKLRNLRGSAKLPEDPGKKAPSKSKKNKNVKGSSSTHEGRVVCRTYDNGKTTHSVVSVSGVNDCGTSSRVRDCGEKVYRGLDVITNKVTGEEMDCVPHHLLDFVDPLDRFTVVDFRNKALPIFEFVERAPADPPGSDVFFRLEFIGASAHTRRVLAKIVISAPHPSPPDRDLWPLPASVPGGPRCMEKM